MEENSKSKDQKGLKSPDPKESGLEKHMNSKLFQRFLKKEGVKLQETTLKPLVKQEEPKKNIKIQVKARKEADKPPEPPERPPIKADKIVKKDSEQKSKIEKEPEVYNAFKIIDEPKGKYNAFIDQSEDLYSNQSEEKYNPTDKYRPVEREDKYNAFSVDVSVKTRAAKRSDLDKYDENSYEKMFKHPIFSPKERSNDINKVPQQKYFSRDQSSEEFSPHYDDWQEKKDWDQKREHYDPIKTYDNFKETEEDLDFDPAEEQLPQLLFRKISNNPEFELKGYSEHLNPGESYAYYDEPSVKVTAKQLEKFPTIVPQAIPPAMSYPLPPPHIMGYYPMYYPPNIPPNLPPGHSMPFDSTSRPNQDVDKDIITKKDEEIKKLQRQLENAKLDYEELEDRLNSGDGILERKYNNLKVERDMLDRKLRATEEENDKLRRELDNSKEDVEAFRLQNEETERSAKIKILDLEREVRQARDSIDDLDRQLIKEKDKNINMTRKIAKKKDEVYQLENDLKKSETTIQRLERDLESARDQNTYDARQQKRDIEALRRQVDSLTGQLENRDVDIRRKPNTNPRNREERPLKDEWFRDEKPMNREEKSLKDD